MPPPSTPQNSFPGRFAGTKPQSIPLLEKFDAQKEIPVVRKFRLLSKATRLGRDTPKHAHMILPNHRVANCAIHPLGYSPSIIYYLCLHHMQTSRLFFCYLLKTANLIDIMLINDHTAPVMSRLATVPNNQVTHEVQILPCPLPTCLS